MEKKRYCWVGSGSQSAVSRICETLHNHFTFHSLLGMKRPELTHLSIHFQQPFVQSGLREVWQSVWGPDRTLTLVTRGEGVRRAHGRERSAKKIDGRWSEQAGPMPHVKTWEPIFADDTWNVPQCRRRSGNKFWLSPLQLYKLSHTSH